MIAKAERVNITDGAIDALITFSDGDMRKSVTFLQVSYKAAGGGVMMSLQSEQFWVSSLT